MPFFATLFLTTVAGAPDEVVADMLAGEVRVLRTGMESCILLPTSATICRIRNKDLTLVMLHSA